MKVEPQQAYPLLYPKNLVLVTSISLDGKPNIITLAWTTPVSFSPLLVGICVGRTRHSNTTIRESGEFAINIPGPELKDAVLRCGSVSGKTGIDKFKQAGLTPLKASRIRAPLIKECWAALECRLAHAFEAGDHTIFVGEVIAAHKFRKGKSLLDKGGRNFTEL